MIDVDSLKRGLDLAAIVAHYSPLQKRGREYVGRCVWHSPDEHPSMWVVPGKGLVHCFSCGASGDAIAFVQHVEGCDFQHACELLGATDDWKPTFTSLPTIKRENRVTSTPPAGTPPPDMKLRGLPEATATWEYRDAEGNSIGYIARYDGEQGKDYFPWTWGSRGDEPPAWACGIWSRPRPLYGLDRLAARPTTPVIVVEGEKAADAAGRLLPAYVVVTWPSGSKAWDRADWEPLRGRKVLLWPDADDPGVKCMQELGAMIADPAGLSCEVHILDVAGMPDGWDAADAEAEGLAVVPWAKPRKQTLPARITATPPAAEEPPAPDMADEPPSEPARRPSRGRPRLTVVNSEGAAAPAIEDDPAPQEFTEVCVADEFAALHQGEFRYVPKWRKWMVWTGSRWQVEDQRTSAMQRIKPLCIGLKYRASAASMTPASTARFGSKKYMASVLDLAESDRRFVARPDQFDADPMLLNTPAGTVDLRDGSIRPAEPADLITRQTGVAPVEGPTPLFDMILHSAHGGDDAIRSYLWRWLGYLLTGDVREECFLFLFGKPRSGKTTLVEAVAAIMGNSDDGGYATKADIEIFTESKRDLAGRLHILYGCRFAYAAETEEGRHWKPSLLKEATGGDTMAGERKYENRFTFRPTHKLLVHGNYRPHMRAVDEGLRRRLHLLEYHGAVTEAERDKTLKARLVAEYPAILFRMVQGCIEWQARGLDTPPEIHANVSSYFESEDSFGSWLEEKTEAKRNARLASGAAYRSFSEYVAERGEHPPPHKRFSMMLQQRGFELTKSGTRYVLGLELRLPELPPIPDNW